MKNLIYLLLAMPLLFTSCNNDNTVFEGEEVQVSFRAEIPVTRAAALTVDKVVCAVFENDNEIDKLRKTIDIVDGEDIVFAPRLIKGRTYDIVFWAMKDNNYNVADMTKIIRNDNATATGEADYDAFTASEEVNVTNSVSLPVTLTRPLAQLNVAISEEDWNAAKNLFGMTPTTTEIKVAKKTFNALYGVAENTVVGGTEYITYNLTASGANVKVNGTDYKSIASRYIFATNESESHIIDITAVKDQNNKVIRSDVQIPAVTLQSNYKTNVVGSILTGTVNCTISIDDTPFTDGTNENIQE